MCKHTKLTIVDKYIFCLQFRESKALSTDDTKNQRVSGFQEFKQYTGRRYKLQRPLRSFTII